MDMLNDDLRKTLTERYSHDQIQKADDRQAELSRSTLVDADAAREVLHLKDWENKHRKTEKKGLSSPGIALDEADAHQQLKERLIFNSLGATPEQQEHLRFLNQRMMPQSEQTGMPGLHEESERPIRNALDLGNQMRQNGLSHLLPDSEEGND